MEKRLKSYIDALFATAPKSAKTEEYKEEIYRNNLEKLNDLIAEGKTEDEAFKIVVDDMGDMSELFSTLDKNEAVSATGNNNNKPRRRRLPTVAKVFIIIGSIVLGIMIVFCILFGIGVRFLEKTITEETVIYDDGNGIHVNVGDITTDVDKSGVHVNVDDDVSVDVGKHGVDVNVDGSFADFSEAEPGNYYDFGELDELNISWASGTVNVVTYDGEGVSVTEENTLGKKFAYKLNDKKLEIKYDKDFTSFSSIFSLADKRVLTVYVPEGISLDKLEIATASAKVELTGIDAKKTEITTTSGSISVSGITAKSLSVSSTSGSVKLDNVTADSADVTTTSGSIKISDCLITEFSSDSVSGSFTHTGKKPTDMSVETISGSVNITLTDISADDELDVETASGSVKITVETDDTDFGIEFESLSGSFNSDSSIAINSVNGIYTPAASLAKPSVIFEVETISGSLNITKK